MAREMAQDKARDFADGLIAWREAGAGDPVFLLHGLGGSRRAWGPQLEALSDQFRCLAWDLPGYGGSAALPELSFESVAAAAVAWLDRLDLDTVDVVGLSFGGMHAQHLALAAPSRVRRLVLADTSPAFGLDGTTAEVWKSARLGPLDDGLTPADMAPAVIDAIVGRPLAASIRQQLIDAFGDIDTAGLRAAVECLPSHDTRDRLADISAPTLVVVGEVDAETPPAYSEALCRGLPSARLEVLPGVGHLTPSEDPNGFNRLVRQFLTAPDPLTCTLSPEPTC